MKRSIGIIVAALLLAIAGGMCLVAGLFERRMGVAQEDMAVLDFEAACRRLEEAGVSFLMGPAKKSGNSIAFFRDPDGNILHLLHRETPLP